MWKRWRGLNTFWMHCVHLLSTLTKLLYMWEKNSLSKANKVVYIHLELCSWLNCRGNCDHHSRKVLPQGTDEVGSEHTPQRQSPALPGHHGNTVVGGPADQLHRACLVTHVWGGGGRGRRGGRGRGRGGGTDDRSDKNIFCNMEGLLNILNTILFNCSWIYCHVFSRRTFQQQF